MESHILEPLPNPKLDGSKLSYVDKEKIKEIYVNLYKVLIKKELKLYLHPYTINPEVFPRDYIIRNKIFNSCKEELRKIYGECFIRGDCLYSLNKITVQKIFKNISIYGYGKNDYTLCVEPSKNERTLNQNDVDSDSLTKQYIEILIKDILHSNPKLEFYKGLFVIKNKEDEDKKKEKKVIEFYPGYTTTLVQTEEGKYLNVTLKNKILATKTIYDYLKENDYKNPKNHEKIKNYLIHQSFQVNYAKKNYKIFDVTFERNPKTQTFMYDRKTINLLEYYKDVYKIEIKDEKQPLLIVKGKLPQKKTINLYFVPELCKLSGIDKNTTQNKEIMKDLSKKTKLKPNERVKKMNDFLNIIKDPEKDPGTQLSAKDKCKIYGIEIKEFDKKLKAYYLKPTKLIGGGENKKKNYVKSNRFEVYQKRDMSNWICLYRKYNYDNADFLSESLIKASKDYGLNIDTPNWGEMEDDDNIEKWIEKVEEKLSENKKANFVIFLLDSYDNIYTDLKIDSLCTKGYISQVVNVESLKKNSLSICSKILLQINAKLSGVSYIPELDQSIKNSKLMIIGVSSSKISGKGGVIGVAMVATINTSYTNFYNKEFIIGIKKKNNKEDKEEEEEEEEEEEDKKGVLNIYIKEFIKEALEQYKKLNKKLPKGIIIYRQGVSFQQKKFLQNEVENIQSACDENNLLYYYILVNTKTTYKFFEKNGEYKNPGSGLLVLDGVIHNNLFEFYIQPQQVNQGSATPTCFHVAYGNLNYPEIIPKLTFDLCHLYSNWQGAVRVPHVLKAAEKLSKLTAKYTKQKLNDKLSVRQSYL